MQAYRQAASASAVFHAHGPITQTLAPRFTMCGVFLGTVKNLRLGLVRQDGLFVLADQRNQAHA
jgi:hypothetical protein